MVNPIIKMSEIEYSFENKAILNKINIQIKQKEILGIVGPNGSGKTTVFNILCGLIKPTKGNIFIDGININNLSITQKSKLIALAPQNTIFPEDISVFELTVMGRNPYMNLLSWESLDDNELAVQYINRVGILQLASKKLKHISGGERQLALIAMVLCQETPIILLDEPTSNLDIKNQLHIMDNINAIRESSNKTILINLHDLNLAAKYCDKIIFLKNGTVFSQGTPYEVITSENIRNVYGISANVLNSSTHPIVQPLSKIP
ncbi:MAG: ABC transporter ATP-binding protein [SAR202 cluster bacterium]|nr:ABC transporter ATP-binding protein [SAR202 cluster bacterium]|tara:strand:+ start:102 stop:887 length:786 start_codon:yes stop_codon:yes gene_type:complete